MKIPTIKTRRLACDLGITVGMTDEEILNLLKVNRVSKEQRYTYLAWRRFLEEKRKNK